jgi:hypothetical protein
MDRCRVCTRLKRDDLPEYPRDEMRSGAGKGHGDNGGSLDYLTSHVVRHLYMYTAKSALAAWGRKQ